jgi:uncharacterized protein DUF6916
MHRWDEVTGERITPMLGTLSKASFAENLNTRFRTVLQDSTVIEMELIEVIDRRSTPRQEQFSLLFRAPQDAPIQQGIYRLDHDRLESGELFLVPVSRDDNGVCYQAVFNRLID